MYYDKKYVISDYFSYNEMNELVDKVKNLVGEMSTGKNLFDGEIELGNINPSDGSLSSSTARTRSKNFIKVKPNTTYSYTRTNTVGYRWIVGYNENKVGITDGTVTHYASGIYTSSQGESTFNFTTTATTEYIKWYDTNCTDLTEKVMINEGNTALPYEPFIQILPPSHYDLDLPTYELNDFIFVEDIDKIERNIMNIGYDFFQPPGYIQNKIWRNWDETDVYKSFGADDLNRMITDMNILYSHKDERPTIYNFYTNENWDGETTLEWE